MVPDQVFSCPPRRFRQVGGGVGEVTSRISSLGLRLEAARVEAQAPNPWVTTMRNLAHEFDQDLNRCFDLQ